MGRSLGHGCARRLRPRMLLPKDPTFEWDERKRWSNLAKHGLDLADGCILFDGRPTLTEESAYAAETRYTTISILDGRMVTLVWTERASTVRLISLRRARDGEKRKYS